MNRMIRCFGGIVLSGLCSTACQTSPKPLEQEPPPQAAQPHHDFIPANFVSRVAYEKGQYKNLLSPKTYALWVDQNISDIKLAYEQQQGNNSLIDDELIGNAAFISAHYIVIECHIESTLPDASVAYDISSLRNLGIYLQASSGAKIYPVHQIIASPAQETRRGTLKQFNRRNFVIFAKEDIISGQSVIPIDTRHLRLYIEGYSTTFYFEWIPQEPVVLDTSEEAPPQDITDIIRWRPNQTETYQVLSVRFSDLYTKLQALTRLPQKP